MKTRFIVVGFVLSLFSGVAHAADDTITQVGQWTCDVRTPQVNQPGIGDCKIPFQPPAFSSAPKVALSLTDLPPIGANS